MPKRRDRNASWNIPDSLSISALRGTCLHTPGMAMIDWYLPVYKWPSSAAIVARHGVVIVPVKSI